MFSKALHSELLKAGTSEAIGYVGARAGIGASIGATSGLLSEDSTMMNGAFKGALLGAGVASGIKHFGNQYAHGFNTAAVDFASNISNSTMKSMNAGYDSATGKFKSTSAQTKFSAFTSQFEDALTFSGSQTIGTTTFHSKGFFNKGFLKAGEGYTGGFNEAVDISVAREQGKNAFDSMTRGALDNDAKKYVDVGQYMTKYKLNNYQGIYSKGSTFFSKYDSSSTP